MSVDTAIAGGGLLLSIVTFGVGQWWERRKWNRGGKAMEGRPSTDQVSREPLSRRISFRVSNMGKSPMMHLTPELVDSAKNVCSEFNDQNIINLLAGERRKLT